MNTGNELNPLELTKPSSEDRFIRYYSYGKHDPEQFLSAIEAEYGKPPEGRVVHSYVATVEDPQEGVFYPFEYVEEEAEGARAITFWVVE